MFGAAFLVRPIGGVILGPLADRIGRRPTLVLTLIGMAVASALIGLLPTATAIGVAAPILLVALRLVQGLSAGGEYATAVIFAAEFSPAGRKGVLTSRVQAGSLAGLLLGALVVLGLSATLGPATMLAWGWRVPFLLALPLGVIGLYLRSRLGETPEFVARPTEEVTAPVDRPLLRGVVLLGVGVLHAVGFYMVFTYGQNLIIKLGFSPVGASGAIAVALVVGIGLVIAGGRASDRWGRPTALLAASGLVIVLSYPLLVGLTGATNWWAVTAFVVLLAAAPSFYTGVAPITYVELFPVHARGTGVSVAYNVTVAIFGGSAVYVTEWLVQATGNVHASAFVLVGAAVVSAVAALALRRLPPAEADDTAVTDTTSTRSAAPAA